jgi:hypothetical protein
VCWDSDTLPGNTLAEDNIATIVKSLDWRTKMIYVSFGQAHVHNINGIIFDKDCIAAVDGGREEVFELFGSKFCTTYDEEEIREILHYPFPRGIIKV